MEKETQTQTQTQTEPRSVNYLDFNLLVGRFLRRHRIENDLSGQELGQLLHISQQQVSRYERGMNGLSLFQLNQFIQALNLSWETFLDEVVSEFYWQGRHRPSLDDIIESDVGLGRSSIPSRMG